MKIGHLGLLKTTGGSSGVPEPVPASQEQFCLALPAQRRIHCFARVLRLPPDHLTQAIQQQKAAGWRGPQGNPSLDGLTSLQRISKNMELLSRIQY